MKSRVNMDGMSAPEKLLLAQQLLESVTEEDAPLTDEQLAELERRLAALDSGEEPCSPWPEALDRILGQK